jgi:D-arabinose 1-dehydrogenase-like Zn-dependent alcohol dehydrogenase
VVGAGGIGAFLVFALAQSGARVSVIETDASRRELAFGLGATLASGTSTRVKTLVDPWTPATRRTQL